MFKKILPSLAYFFDTLKQSKASATIEKLSYDNNLGIVAHYSYGRRKIMDDLPILEFESKFFDALDEYHRRLANKYSTLQEVLDSFFNKDSMNSIRSSYIEYIKEQIDNEQAL